MIERLKAVGLYTLTLGKLGIYYSFQELDPEKQRQTDIPGVTLNANGEIESYDIEDQCHSVFE